MKIANIIHEKELVNHTKVEYINYFNEPIEYNKLDKLLPTLYVGWQFMKTSNSDNQVINNAEILRKKIITNELYWEFSFAENKSAHVKGVDDFVEAVPLYYFFPKYTYINLDPVGFQLRDVQDLMDVVPKQIDFLYNYKNEMVYFLKDDKITGIYLTLYSFFKFNINELLDRLQERTTNSVNDLDAEIYQSYYKIFPKFEFLKRYLVTILK